MCHATASYLFWSHAALGICVDVALLVNPIWLIYSRMLHSMAAFKVILVFGFCEFQIALDLTSVPVGLLLTNA